YKWPPYTQSISNFVVTHIGVIAHDECHAGARAQFVQGFADFFAGALFDEPFELVWLRSFERNVVYVVHIFLMTSFAAAQNIPAMVGRNFVEPGGERAAGIVLGEFVAQLHENLHGGVFRIFLAGQSTPAKAKDRRCKFPVQIAPSLGIPSPSLGD